jgi:hypothetical protein
VDSSVHIFGLRLNTYVASILLVFGLAWFYRIQHRPGPAAAQPEPAGDPTATEVHDSNA